MKFCDDQSHLQTPVSQMYITNHIMTDITAHTLYTLTDNSGTKMSHMQWFCHIGSAVIHDDRLWLGSLLATVTLICLHLTKILCQILLR